MADHTSRIRRLLSCSLAAAVLLTLATTASAQLRQPPAEAAALAPRQVEGTPTLDDPNLTIEIYTSGLSLPTTMAFLGPDDLLVLEKATGNVRRVIGGVLQPQPVLTVPVNTSSERGLLGIAINSQNPPNVFLYYTEDPPLANRVYCYTWNSTSGLLEDPHLILDLPATPGPNHDGGVLVLGPPSSSSSAEQSVGTECQDTGDGAPLFAIIGDLNRNGQLQNFPAGASPDDTSVVIRVRQDGTPFPGNPFTPYCTGMTTQTCMNDGDCVGVGTCVTEVASYYGYGIRNSFGLTLDPITGDLWDTENGPADYDEVNHVLIGSNSGWEQIMGPDSRDPQGVGDLWNMPGAGLTYSDPEFSWLTTIAPTGILFPVGSSWGPAYDDAVLVGDNNFGNLYALPLDGPRNAFDLSGLTGLDDLVADSTTERNLLRIGQSFAAITDLEVGPDGAVYVADIGAGTIYRISGPAQIFADGFESGDTSAWTSTVP